MEKIRFAVIGTGWITQRFLEAAGQCELFSLVGVYSRSLDRAQEFAEKNGASLTFDHLDKLALCTEVDAVYIASPTCFHYRQSL
ncbi:MAG: Gfo/Idh/MocA family oxidoreductase, partial [Acetivibrio sp.]